MLLQPLASFRKRLARSSRRTTRKRRRKRYAVTAAQVERLEDRILLCHTAGSPSDHGGCDGGGGGGDDGGDEVSYVIQDLGTLGGDDSRLTVDHGLNEAGFVAGQSLPAGATGEFWEEGHAFLVVPEDSDGDGQPDTWFRDDDADGTNDLMIDLGTLGGAVSTAYSVNDIGQVVGGATTDAGNVRAYLWEDANDNGQSDAGEMIDLGTLEGFEESQARAVNNRGQVIGWLRDADGNKHLFLIDPEDSDGDGMPDTWFRDSDSDGANDLMTHLLVHNFESNLQRPVLTDINDAGQIVGIGKEGFDDKAFVIIPEDTDGDGNPDRWVRDDDGDGVNDLATVLPGLGGGDSQAWGNNADGQIAGNARDEDGELHAALWELDADGNPVITDLGTVNGTDHTHGRDVNNFTQVVGHSTKTKGSSTEQEPFIWQNGTITKLKKLITDMDSLDDLDEAVAINDSGHIIGQEFLEDKEIGPTRVWIAVPDTSTSALHVAGEAAAQSTGSQPLSHDVLQPVLQQAADHWSAAELDVDHQQDLDVRIANLSGTLLGMANENARTIWIDQDAAGYGWSANTSSDDGVDLLSVVTHEAGHVLGLEHSDEHGVMAPRLAPGEPHVGRSNLAIGPITVLLTDPITRSDYGARLSANQQRVQATDMVLQDALDLWTPVDDGPVAAVAEAGDRLRQADEQADDEHEEERDRLFAQWDEDSADALPVALL